MPYERETTVAMVTGRHLAHLTVVVHYVLLTSGPTLCYQVHYSSAAQPQ